MRIDLISIFPEFFDVLDLSLIGKAQRDELLTVHRHQLRDFSFDKHRSVDDTPTGGGAGMVMKPEPWALALEHVLTQRETPTAAEPPILIIPTPAGEVLTQRTAQQLAQAEHLVFAPGRFEGIDQRLMDWAPEHFQVRPMSIGDYVLNGGESAVVVMVEAITRLIPGVLGNPESLAEESHAHGLLEYPVYTKPARWRGLDVPEILLSGDHAKIAAWRAQQQDLRTRKLRPDLWARHVVAQEQNLA
ncbi:tRNA (guanosine(37)-N1)-methyltransferase TrmD [Nesterenkonia sandarakina]|uniref:tRNA (guanine-N(1)-)-methyltransferase n=1 Tax=Nesterenkonia sandarakina TaxID=272918 RepID=A0A2T0YTC0_9MICC|nr:tRNA (guanosine(37)-N1)-methyltransferase TrmD [Nesterenkonia sandarakina]PRZ18865.1 tRNA (guanine37-N(1)-) methyltransferase [Nesterenkonia sandarakina]